jgi:hypothetical protein
MKLPRVQRTGKEGTNAGFNPVDQYLLDKANTHEPRIQIINKPQLGDIDERPLCLECGSRLTYFSSENKYQCSYARCGKMYNAPDTYSNTPMLAKKNQDMNPYQSQQFNPNNPDAQPFFASFGPDSGGDSESKDYEITWSSVDNRVKHIKCKNGFPKDISLSAFKDEY